MSSSTTTAGSAAFHHAGEQENQVIQDWDSVPDDGNSLEVVAAAAAAAASALQDANSHSGFFTSHHGVEDAPAPPGVHEGVLVEPFASQRDLIEATAAAYAAASQAGQHPPPMSSASGGLEDWSPLALANSSGPTPHAPGTAFSGMEPPSGLPESMPSSQQSSSSTGRGTRARSGRNAARSSGTAAEGSSSPQKGRRSSRSRAGPSKKARFSPADAFPSTGDKNEDDDDDDQHDDDDVDDGDDRSAVHASTSVAGGKRKADSDKAVPSTVGNAKQQQEWRSVIETRMASMNQDSRHVNTTRKRFLSEDAQLSKPTSACDSCSRNGLPCYLSPPHIKCCSCTLKGETCSFGLVRHSRKRKAHAERDSVLRQARLDYIGKWRDLMGQIIDESRKHGAEDVAKLVEDRLGACITEMEEDMEGWVPKEPIALLKPGKLQE
ncbi:hypothetical protein A4X13_0g4045 [Tilletia indica]|uniref:Uncharacterized protein n=1 Tax=Tilletia indica TaxID=43049 RepID=A0A177TT90_9BASI|nr:hypothetical protein A4X13_0g4045 [Tilletia indica]